MISFSLRLLWRRYRRWESARLLRRSVAINPEPLNAYILERANEATLQSVMAHFRRRGIQVCAVCTGTHGGLRRVGDAWACAAHVQTVRAMEAERAAAKEAA